MISSFLYFAFLHNNNLVSILDCRQPMGNYYCCYRSELIPDFIYGSLDFFFIFLVEGAGGLI